MYNLGNRMNSEGWVAGKNKYSLLFIAEKDPQVNVSLGKSVSFPVPTRMFWGGTWLAEGTREYCLFQGIWIFSFLMDLCNGNSFIFCQVTGNDYSHLEIEDKLDVYLFSLTWYPQKTKYLTSLILSENFWMSSLGPKTQTWTRTPFFPIMKWKFQVPLELSLGSLASTIWPKTVFF